jgi:hypothetical protein
VAVILTEAEFAELQARRRGPNAPEFARKRGRKAKAIMEVWGDE